MKIHLFYLMIVALVGSLYFRHETSTRSLSVQVKPIGEAQAACPPDLERVNQESKYVSGQPITTPLTSLPPQLPTDFSPRDLLKIIPRQEPFDSQIVSRHSEIDLSEYREAQLLEEDEYGIVHRLTGPNGHDIVRTTSKDGGTVWFEEWEDNDGKVQRQFYEDGFYDTFTDKSGNVFQYGKSKDGRKTMSRKNALTGMVETVDYNSDGSVKGVYLYKDNVAE